MILNDRIHQFADDLAQRKLLIDNRIALLKANPVDNLIRLEVLEAVKKNISELQESFFDHFYNELSSSTEPQPDSDRVGEYSKIINLDETMADNNLQDVKPGQPDLSKLLTNIKNIQDQHRNE